jgi:general secretion pathway protein D
LAAGNVTLGALVHALESTGEANVLSTPNIMTMDNEEAEIIVGQNVPFVTGQNSTAGGVANPFQTIERKDIGLTLRVKPQISEGDTVRLEIYQEVSSISTTAGASDLITNKRSVKTVALAKDGQMLVLGGLIREDTSSNVNKVPCLGSIPLVGEPFKFTDNIRRKVNLMVFLRPRIIRTDADIMDVTNEKYSSIKSLYEAPSPQGTILFPHPDKQLPEDMTPSVLKMDEAMPAAETQGAQ